VSELLLVIAALFLAFGNGANDNFKGFATVWGSGTLGYRQALTLAAVATACGCLASVVLAQGLLEQFSGKGLVAGAAVSSPPFLGGVAAGASATVLLATRFGVPVSTTHALVGGLMGAAVAQVEVVNIRSLGSAFFFPLLAAPLIAAGLGMLAHRLLARWPAARDCACVVECAGEVVAADGVLARRAVASGILVASARDCDQVDAAVRVSIPRSLDRLHVLSAMAICFARSVNDTPKLAALLLAAHSLDVSLSIAAIAIVMVAGGLAFARRVARTMSQRITRMDHAQGLAANLITAGLVLFASKLGLPVSTTHVSVGSIAGVGASAEVLNWRVLSGILLAWTVTLPLSAAIAFLVVRPVA
jgi:PiT family inorganic phosphate transporter